MPGRLGFGIGVSMHDMIAATAGGGLSDYAVGNFEPALVADFMAADGGYYRALGEETTFDTLLDTPTFSLATMYNSDGKMAWCPHQLSNRTDDPTDWSPAGTTSVSASEPWVVTALDNTGSNRIYTSPKSGNLADGEIYRFYARVRQTNHNYIGINYQGANATGDAISAVFDLSAGTGVATSTFEGATSGTISTTSITDNGDGTFDIWMEGSTLNIVAGNRFHLFFSDSATPTYATTGLVLWNNDGDETFGWVHAGIVHPEFPTEHLATVLTSPVYTARHNAYVFDDTVWALGGLRYEGQARTNLETYSNDPTQNWAEGPDNATTVQTADDAWGNENRAWYILDDSGGGTSNVYIEKAGIVHSLSSYYCLSFYASAGGLNWVAVGFENLGGLSGEAYANLSTGEIGTVPTNVTVNLEKQPSGFYRVMVTYVTDAVDATGDLRIYVGEGDSDKGVSTTYGSSSIIIHDIQHEEVGDPGVDGEVREPASSLIPTRGATVARTADPYLDVPASQVVLSGAVSWYAKALCNMPAGDNGLGFLEVTQGGGFIRTQITDPGRPFTVLDGSANTRSEGVGSDITVPAVNRELAVAARFDDNLVQMAWDGDLLTANTDANIMSDFTNHTSFYLFGRGAATLNHLMGYAQEVRQFDADIGEANIQEVTTLV